MRYAIPGENAEHGAARRASARPAHLRRIEQLVQGGRLVLAGPFPAVDSPDPGSAGRSGGLIVARFDSLQAARDWMEADPYVTGGAFRSATVRSFRKVLP